MQENELQNVKKVRGASNEQAANQMLEKGWVMLSTASGQDEQGYPITRYSLGWFKDANPDD